MGPMWKQICHNDSLLGRTTEEDCTDLVLEGLMSPAWNFSRMWQLIPSFRENTWLPDCPSTRSHLLVSQVLSPGPRSALTRGFAETSNSLDFKASLFPWTLSIQGLCNCRNPNFIVIWTCIKMLFMPPNWTSIHTGISARTAPLMAIGLPAGLQQTELMCSKLSISWITSDNSVSWSETRTWAYTQLIEPFLHMLELQLIK